MGLRLILFLILSVHGFAFRRQNMKSIVGPCTERVNHQGCRLLPMALLVQDRPDHLGQQDDNDQMTCVL